MRYGRLPYGYIISFVALPYLLAIYPIFKAISDSVPFDVTKDVSAIFTRGIFQRDAF